MPSCVVRGCKERSLGKNRETGTYFHCFPNRERSPKRLRAWIDFCGRDDFVPTRHSTVCSKHFLESDYDRTQLMKLRLMPNESLQGPKLVPGTVPSIRQDLAVYRGGAPTASFTEVERGRLAAAPLNDLGPKKRRERKQNLKVLRHVEISKVSYYVPTSWFKRTANDTEVSDETDGSDVAENDQNSGDACSTFDDTVIDESCQAGTSSSVPDDPLISMTKSEVDQEPPAYPEFVHIKEESDLECLESLSPIEYISVDPEHTFSTHPNSDDLADMDTNSIDIKPDVRELQKNLLPFSEVAVQCELGQESLRKKKANSPVSKTPTVTEETPGKFFIKTEILSDDENDQGRSNGADGPSDNSTPSVSLSGLSQFFEACSSCQVKNTELQPYAYLDQGALIVKCFCGTCGLEPLNLI